MKKILAAIALFCACFTAASAQKTDAGLLVQMPVPPASMERLDARCNYIVDNYWKTFNPKSSFSSLERLDNTMGAFFSVTPYATADTVFASIGRMLEAVAKAKPDNLLTMARLAEKWCYNDTAEYDSEQLYFPFVEAVATNKKIKGAEKARYELQYRQIKNSQVGAQMPDLSFVDRNGQKSTLSSVTAPHVLLFFYDPDCLDCRMAKARLAADYTLSQLLATGNFALVAIYPGDATKEWSADAQSLPKEWVVGAAPDADTQFTMRRQPEIYYITPQRQVAVKDIDVDTALRAFKTIAAAPAQPSQTAQ